MLTLVVGTAHAETLYIKGKDGEKARFNVELANTDETRVKGLMNRKQVLPDSGMLFIYDSPQTVQMWMKNTFVPLDMLFATPDGTIAHIVRNAQPHDLTPRGPERADIKFVLEVPAGTAMMHGIQPGDRFSKEP